MNASHPHAPESALRAFLQQQYRPGRPYETLQSLIDEGFDALPYPGGGDTRSRWRMLADIGSVDLCLAKLFESHTDALAIFHELRDATPAGPVGMCAVWCSEPPTARVTLTPCERDGREVTLTGTKAWCSGARHVRSALVSAWDGETPCLVFVDLAQAQTGRIEVEPKEWHAIGMACTQSFDVTFHEARAHRVGAPGAYLSRPGFHHGGAGIAACWYGAAAGIADVVRETMSGRSDDPHALAHMGVIDVALVQAASVLRETAQMIDAHPEAPSLHHVRRARLSVEACAETVLRHAPRAVGPGPMCRNARFAQLLADLPVFIRQSHAERDLAELGQSVVAHDTDALWTL
ncbi:acyl-CoA dehydrogenase family protein [Pandoraea sputorum]|uniref:acyl-CoA dehydrogenase family protein n=1 Tax=Pandoraea sputorum TaxID=93222 RepID=UPI002AF6B72D|nr:acyl-CoA dehydrogenase family protein [Pandoraea sputorum]